KVESLTFMSGPPHSGWLNALKSSARNCALYLSPFPNRTFLNSDRSKLLYPGVRTLGIVRGPFPMVNGPGCENTDVLNHLEWVGLLTFASCPLQSGLCENVKIWV